MCGACFSNKTAVEITQRQLDFLKLPLEEQEAQYKIAYENFIATTEPDSMIRSDGEHFSVYAPFNKWSRLRIAIYLQIAAFGYGFEAHLNAVELLNAYEQDESFDGYSQMTNPYNAEKVSDWRQSLIKVARDYDNSIWIPRYIFPGDKYTVTMEPSPSPSPSPYNKSANRGCIIS
jgi:hypothetical protein